MGSSSLTPLDQRLGIQSEPGIWVLLPSTEESRYQFHSDSSRTEVNYLPREVLLFLLLREKDQAALSEYKFNFRKMWLYEMDPIFLGSNSCWEGSGLSLSCVGRSSSTKWLWIHVAEDGSLQQHHYPYQDQQSWFLSLKLKPESNSSHKLCNRFSSRAKPENY